MSSVAKSPTPHRHALWVRGCHWVVALSVLTLACSGFVVLLAHPRLYWGEVGNDLMPAWLELPLNHNHQPSGWEQTVTFEALAGKPISANRTVEVFNQNSWARSLHFLAGWVFVVAGALYLVLGVFTRHVWRDLWPRGLRQNGSGPYTLIQRYAYTIVGFVVLPFMALAGLTMSPRVVAAFPELLDVFGGHQSARTLHFFGFVLLLAFIVGHVAMVVRSGFRRHMRAMIVGR